MLHGLREKKYMMMAWTICGFGAIYYCYEYLLRITPSVMEDALRSHFALSASGFGLLSAFYYYAYVPLQIPVGILLDRYGPKLLITLACLICVIGTFIFAGSNLFWLAATGRFLVGFGSAFAFVGVLKLATIWLPEDKLGMVAGIASALGTIGAMLGDNVMGALVIKFGWRETVNLSAYFGMVLVFVLWFGIQDRRRYQRESGTIQNFRKSIRDLVVIIRNPQIWINGMIGCLLYLPTTVFGELWGIPYLEHAHGLSVEGASFANSLVFFGFMIGAPLMGLISDKLKRRRYPLLIGATCAAVLMLIVLYSPGLSQVNINILLFLLGLFYSSQCLVFAVGRELSPNEAAGTAMATTNMMVMLGAMVLQPLIGALLDFSVASRSGGAMYGLAIDKIQPLYTSYDYGMAMSIIPAGIIIAAILTFFLKET